MRRLILPVLATLVAAASAPRAYACPPPIETPTPLDAQVSAADFILIAMVTDIFIDPPLDPATPDDVTHGRYARLEASEHLKGAGPATIVFWTGTSYYFTETGELDTIVIDCGGFNAGPAGTPYVLLLSQPIDSPGILASMPMDTPFGQDFLQQVRDILAATPTPTPTPAPTPSPEPSPTPTPAALPAVLPPTGTAPARDSRMPALLAATLLAASVLAAAALAARARDP